MGSIYREAIEMRMAGKTYEEIGKMLGVSKQRAERIIKDSLYIDTPRPGRKPDYVYPAVMKAMQEKGFSAAMAASRAHISPVHFSKIMNGKIDPRLSTAKQIAKVLDLRLEEAFSRDDNI